MRLMAILFACLLSSTLISPSAARPARKPVPQKPAQPAGPPLTYSASTLAEQIAKLRIAGVSWGQRDSIAMSELREAGFTITGQDKDEHESFDELVKRYIQEGAYHEPLYMITTGAYSVRAEKPNERITVAMWAVPDGWRVGAVSYEYTGGLAPRELEQTAVEKYQGLGFRINGQSGWNIICLPSAKHWSELPNITIKPTGGRFTLELSGGESGAETFSKPFEDAVAKRKGLDKPSF